MTTGSRTADGTAADDARPRIERVGQLDEPGFDTLLAESEQAGLRLLRRLADEWASGLNRFDRPGEALFAARVGSTLVAVGGLNVDPTRRRRGSAACATYTSTRPIAARGSAADW